MGVGIDDCEIMRIAFGEGREDAFILIFMLLRWRSILLDIQAVKFAVHII